MSKLNYVDLILYDDLTGFEIGRIAVPDPRNQSADLNPIGTYPDRLIRVEGLDDNDHETIYLTFCKKKKSA